MGSHGTCRFTVRIPPSASNGSFHCAIGFRSLPTDTEADGAQMRTAVRMIAAIYPIVGKIMIKRSDQGTQAGASFRWRRSSLEGSRGVPLGENGAAIGDFTTLADSSAKSA